MYTDLKISRLNANIEQLRERINKAEVVMDTYYKRYIRAIKARERVTDPVYAEEIDEKIKTLEVYVNSKRDFIKDNTARIYLAKSQIEQIRQQEADNRIPAIEKFMDGWETKSRNYYTREARQYLNQWTIYQYKIQDIKDKLSSFDKEYRTLRNQASVEWNKYDSTVTAAVRNCVDRRLRIVDETKMNQMISEERYRKTKNLLTGVTKYVGKITDATGLYVSSNLELNGRVIGIEGKAVVETIYAGGYNIQCLHFRVLVNKIS